MEDFIEKRHYKGKKNSDIVNYPVFFRRELFSPSKDKSVLNMPISAHRIVFKILNDISNDQFRKENKKQAKQLELFEEEFKTENNCFARFTFPISHISDTRNYNNIQKGLDFLETYKRGWYKAKNKKGRVIKSLGGLISLPNISNGKVTFLVNAYWLEKLADLSYYNVAYFKTPWLFSKSKHILFYLWLLEVPDKGTKIDFNNFQEVYEYNYKDANSLAKDLLKPIKDKLDKSSNKSFNYSVKKDIIHITPYYTKDVDYELKDDTKFNQSVTQKLHYWKVRHKLSDNDIDILKSCIKIDKGNFKLFTTAYSNIIKKNRGKKKVTDYIGVDFINRFQIEIVKVYNESVWGDIIKNGYPKIE